MSGWVPARLAMQVDGEGVRVSLRKTWLRAGGAAAAAGLALGLWYVGGPGALGDGKTVGLLVAFAIAGGAVVLFNVFFAFTNRTLVARRFARHLEIERTWLSIPYSTRHVDVSDIKGVSVSESLAFGGSGGGASAAGVLFAILGALFSPAMLLSFLFSPKKKPKTNAACAIRIRLREGGAIITHPTRSRPDCHAAVRAIREAVPELAPVEG